MTTTEKKAGDTARSIEPCRHMERWVNGLADGSIKGAARLYTLVHVFGCIQCRTAMLALKQLRRRLRDLNNSPEACAPLSLTADRRAALDAALDEINRRNGEY